jgi:hypothetical protein
MAPTNSVFREENFIPGVFNYCNSWCERCQFRLRCRNYAMVADEEGHPIDLGEDDAMERIEENLRKAMDMLSGEAQEHGFDTSDFEELAPEDLQHLQREHDREMKTARTHPLGVMSRAYSDEAMAWLEANRSELDRLLMQLQSQTATHIQGSQLANAREVAQWYVFLIHVKCHRALTGLKEMSEDRLHGNAQNDANGSAKVALLGAEGSLAAWVTIAELLPHGKAPLMSIMALLYRTIRSIQQVFPNARKFIRAGFDDGSL